MSKKLEERVQDLVSVSERRREIGREKYQVDKEYRQTEEEVRALLESGHTMPEGSEYYANLEEEESGRLSYKYVVEEMQERYPQYSGVIEGLKQESRELLVERVKYGVLERAEA